MQTCLNDLGLNLCVVLSTSHVVTISEDSLVRSYKKRNIGLGLGLGLGLGFRVRVRV